MALEGFQVYRENRGNRMNKISDKGQDLFVKWRKFLVGRILRQAGKWKEKKKKVQKIASKYTEEKLKNQSKILESDF